MMYKSTSPLTPILYSLPFIVILTAILLSQSVLFEQQTKALSIGIQADLIFTLPLVYFFAIRKTKIPNTTVIPVFIIGLTIGYFIIPQPQQGILDAAKNWVLPLIEISLLSFTIFKIRKAIKVHKKSVKTFDFYTDLKSTLSEILPQKVAGLMSMEFGTIYYGFIHWRKVKLKDNQYSYHKNTGTRALLLVLVFIIAIETFVFHILLVEWSQIAAWILTLLSLYSGIQIIGFLKSLSKRPIRIEHEYLKLRYGILAEVDIPLDSIETIEKNTKSIEANTQLKFLSPLGSTEGQNLIIHLKNTQTLQGLYGFKHQFSQIAIHVDTPDQFITGVKTAQDPTP